VATAAVHADLAEVLPTSRLAAEDLSAVADTFLSRLEAAVAEVPGLAPYAETLRARYAAVRDLREPVGIQRVHGDLHLGQALRTTGGWTLLDFEGEPLRSLQSRRGLDTPLRDIAGMLRSFDYASRALLVDEAISAGGDVDLYARAHEWAARNSEAFCDGYAVRAGADPRDEAILLSALEADKAVYEAIYEARSRPKWLPIPLGALDRICQRS
jgi:maltokinase